MDWKMSKIISLGVEVADIHRRYSTIHGALFGASSFRMVIDVLSGKGGRAYAKYHQTLVELLGLLEDLELRVKECGRKEGPSRGADELRKVLLEYSAALVKVIAGLAGICQRLEQDEQGYRRVDSTGRSRFNRDKVNYDYALSDLENLGNKLNRLFSSY